MLDPWWLAKPLQMSLVVGRLIFSFSFSVLLLFLASARDQRPQPHTQPTGAKGELVESPALSFCVSLSMCEARLASSRWIPFRPPSLPGPFEEHR